MLRILYLFRVWIVPPYGGGMERKAMYVRLMGNGKKGVIEPFYDGGEAYRDYHKYETLKNYTQVPQGSARQTWCGVNFMVMPRGTVSARRTCKLELERFDEIYLEAKVPDFVTVKLRINGAEIINQQGTGKIDEYHGKASEKTIKSIEIEFYNDSDSLYEVPVNYIGVEDSKFPTDDEINGGNTIPDWEGCFEEKPDIELFSNFFVSDGEVLRKKMKSPFYVKNYEKTKESMKEYMDFVPESAICGVAPTKGPELYGGAAGLAFVGYIEKDIEMLKMAARYALSLASCCTWYIEPKELVTGVTWNGRVFKETFAVYGLSIFMEFAGGILTWHGRNYIYEAIVNKGISRLDGDFKRMEYIYHMNQGLAFSPGYIYGLITLTKRFPRYKKRIDEIEADVNEMLAGTIKPDGGIPEGLGYYGYTIESYSLTAGALARYRGKSIYEYINGRLDKPSDFMLTMSGGKNVFRTVGDTGRYSFGKHICMFMYQATKNPLWKKYYEIQDRKQPDGWAVGAWYFAYLLYGEPFEYDGTENIGIKDGFYCFPDCGYTYLKRDGVEFFSISGQSFSHCHPDKGSFTIDADGEPILIDRGMVGYNEACADIISSSTAHNMTVPVVNGIMFSQHSQHGYGSVMKKSEYRDGVLEWICDNNNVWDKNIVVSNVRTIKSDNPFEYTVTDEFEFTGPTQAAFILNMYDHKRVKAEPVNWKPLTIECEPYSVDYAKRPVMRLVMLSEKNVKLTLTTKITIIKEREEC